MTTPLILDANILIRAVLGRRVFSLIDRYHRSARFVTPSVCIDDARKYLPKMHIPEHEKPLFRNMRSQHSGRCEATFLNTDSGTCEAS